MDSHVATTAAPLPPRMHSPERWLAVLRIALGLWFAKALVQKLSITLAWGFLPVPTASERWILTMPVLVAKYASGNPVTFFKNFLETSVVPHASLFAQLTAFGEVAVGVGLVAGCLTRLAAGIGLVLVVNYGLAVGWQGSAQQGFHYLLITTLVVVLVTGAGRTWGVDGWVRARRPQWWLARVPLG